jgi:hypothetical protein
MARASSALRKIKKGCQVSGVTLTNVVTERSRQRIDQLSLSHLRRSFPCYGIRLSDQEYQELAPEFKSGDGISISDISFAIESSGITRE